MWYNSFSKTCGICLHGGLNKFPFIVYRSGIITFAIIQTHIWNGITSTVVLSSHVFMTGPPLYALLSPFVIFSTFVFFKFCSFSAVLPQNETGIVPVLSFNCIDRTHVSFWVDLMVLFCRGLTCKSKWSMAYITCTSLCVVNALFMTEVCMLEHTACR